jgi:hypothetical protein
MAKSKDEDKIEAELDRILTEEVMAAGESALAGWCNDPGVAAYAAFVAMWRAMRKAENRETQST